MSAVIQLLQNALYGTALILTAALLRRILAHRLIPEARLVLWALCLFRLLAPAGPESTLSLWGLLGRPRAPAPTQPPLYLPPHGGSPYPYPVPPSAPQVSTPAPAGFPWEMALAAVWLGVGLVLAVRYALSWRRTHRAVKGAAPIPRPDPRYLPLPRCARLREGAVDGAPLTFGTVRPTVVLIPGLSGAELDCVLAHEGVHARRGDNVWHYGMALALTVYWWNPAVWLMARLLRRDIELSCDRAAVQGLGLDRRADYARALVSLATQGEGSAFSRPFGQKLTEERIIMIMNYKKPALLSTVLTLLLVLSLSVALGTSPAAAVSAPNPAESGPVESAGEPAETVGVQVENFDQSILDAAHDKITRQMTELSERVLDEELNGKPAASVQPSACPHLRIINAGRCKIYFSISETAHTVIDLTCKWCVNCQELVVGSREKTEQNHSFGPDQYVGANHTSPNPSDHFITFGHTCTGCSFYTTYTVSSGCTKSGCVNPYSVTPQPASDQT